MQKSSVGLVVWEDEKTVEKVKEIYGKDLTDPEWNIFLSIGKVTGLNPFLRELYAVKYGSSPASIFVGRDGYRKSAQKHPEYDYHIVEVVREKDIIEMHDGDIRHKKNFFDKSKIVGAYCICKRKSSSKPNYNFVQWDEYYAGNKDENGKTKKRFDKYKEEYVDMKPTIWDTKPETMIKKVAEAQTLRMTFQELFAGTYDESEDMAETSTVQVVDAKRYEDLNFKIANAESPDELVAVRSELIAAYNAKELTDEQVVELKKLFASKKQQAEAVKDAETIFGAKAEPAKVEEVKETATVEVATGEIVEKVEEVKEEPKEIKKWHQNPPMKAKETEPEEAKYDPDDSSVKKHFN